MASSLPTVGHSLLSHQRALAVSITQPETLVRKRRKKIHFSREAWLFSASGAGKEELVTVFFKGSHRSPERSPLPAKPNKAAYEVENSSNRNIFGWPCHLCRLSQLACTTFLSSPPMLLLWLSSCALPCGFLLM